MLQRRYHSDKTATEIGRPPPKRACNVVCRKNDVFSPSNAFADRIGEIGDIVRRTCPRTCEPITPGRVSRRPPTTMSYRRRRKYNFLIDWFMATETGAEKIRPTQTKKKKKKRSPAEFFDRAQNNGRVRFSRMDYYCFFFLFVFFIYLLCLFVFFAVPRSFGRKILSEV